MSNQLDDKSKFELEKTCSSLVVAGKRSAASLAVFFILLASASIITFAGPSQEVVKVPFFNLDLQKWHAAEVLLALSSITFYQFVVFIGYENMLSSKFEMLLRKYELPQLLWIVRYPSFFRFHVSVLDNFPKVFKALSVIPIIVLIFGASIYIPFLIIRIGSGDNYSVSWIISICLSSIFVISSFVIMMGFPGETEDIIDNMEAVD